MNRERSVGDFKFRVYKIASSVHLDGELKGSEDWDSFVWRVGILEVKSFGSLSIRIDIDWNLGEFTRWICYKQFIQIILIGFCPHFLDQIQKVKGACNLDIVSYGQRSRVIRGHSTSDNIWQSQLFLSHIVPSWQKKHQFQWKSRIFREGTRSHIETTISGEHIGWICV